MFTLSYIVFYTQAMVMATYTYTCSKYAQELPFQCKQTHLLIVAYSMGSDQAASESVAVLQVALLVGPSILYVADHEPSAIFRVR